MSRARLHPAWLVAGVTFATLLAAGAFRSVPGTLMQPLSAEFGWSLATISTAVSVNLILYGLISPFAAALMQRIGIQTVVAVALVLVALGAGGSVSCRRAGTRPDLGRPRRRRHRFAWP